MANGWIHETMDLIVYGRPYRYIHKLKDEESQRKPGRRHREVKHEWYQAFGKLWSFSDPFPDFLKEDIQRLKDVEGADSAEERIVSDAHDYLDRIWDCDELPKPERDWIRKYWEGLFAWLLFRPEILKDWAGVDVLNGKIQRFVEGQETWEDAPDIKSEYKRLCHLVNFVISRDGKLREIIKHYGRED